MKQLDLSANPRIPVLMELVNSMHHVTDPRRLLETFVIGMRRAYGTRFTVQLSTTGLSPGEYRIVRILAPNESMHLDMRSLRQLAVGPVHRGGAIGQAITSGSPVILHDLDLGHDSAMGGRLSAYRSLMASPIFANELGVDWVVIFDPDPGAFDDKDLEDIILRVNLVAAMVNNLDTARKLADANERIQREIDSIGRIQKALLPESLPAVPGVKLAASYRTFDRAGGDLYDISRLGDRMESWKAVGDENWAVLIGDVSGHGPAAAVVMAMFHAILHAYPVRPRGPAELLTHANRHLCAKRIEQSFVTAFLGFYNSSTRQLTYARAGHAPPLVKGFPQSAPASYLNAVGDLPLGIFHDVIYHEASTTLHPGQTLILYTDGVTEARRPGGELFGIEGIERSLVECTGAPECAIQLINEGLQAHQGDTTPDDDQTILAMQMVERGSAQQAASVRA